MICDGKIETCLKCPYAKCINDENVSIEEIIAADSNTLKRVYKTPEHKREYLKQYYKDHKERIAERIKVYKEKNKEKIKEYKHKHYMEHRTEYLARQKEYYRKKKREAEAI